MNTNAAMSLLNALLIECNRIESCIGATVTDCERQMFAQWADSISCIADNSLGDTERLAFYDRFVEVARRIGTVLTKG
jgi:hypothetical protein